MFFQINITPKQKKAAEPITKAKVNNNYSLLLAPFQPPTRIKLDTHLNSSVECELTIKNSNNRRLTVTVTKVPPDERCINLSATEWSIESESSVTLNITWEPKEEGSWRDILQLSDGRRIKYDVPLILNSINPNKGMRKKTLGKTTKKPILVSKTSHMSLPRNSTLASQKTVLTDNKQAPSKTGTQPAFKRTRTTSIDITDKENTSYNVGFNWMLNQAQAKKERKEQTTPRTLDFSKFLDSSHFKFTPVKSKFASFESNLECNSIQFTPQNDNNQLREQKQESTIAVEKKIPIALRKETYITVPKFLNVPSSEVENENQDNNEFDDSLSPKSIELEKEKPCSEMSMLFDDIKFTPFKGPDIKQYDVPFSPKCCSTGNKSNISKSFSEDSGNKSSSKNATFEIDCTISNEQNNTYELPKSPTSTRNSSDLKPLRLVKAFDKNNLEIEFSTPLPVRSKSDDLANDHARCSNQFSKSQIDGGSAKDCLEADLWVKCKNTSISPISKSLLHSTLKSIREEDDHFTESIAENKNITLRENAFEKKPNPLCIEISPPKKYSNYKKVIKKISPTKSGKVLKEKPSVGVLNLKKKIQINNTSLRHNNLVAQIPGVKITKLSLSKLNSDKDKNNLSKIKKQSKESSVKLHDPNDFLTMLCNPDPFAATMTQDPFLASTLYYDDKWIFIQELEFKKWLNALLTPPEHLSADVESAAIDVGKVWQCCRGKEDFILAETKESLSARYHTNTRLNTLRKAACLMFRRAEVITALSQTTVGIEKEILIIRPDKDLHRDIGLQKIILELFISYNPLWLRIGLETIYGETIPLQSNNDLIGLSRFLLNRFFSDPFIVKQHSASNHPNIRLATFQTVMNKFMLKKFLFLVYFLDYAKRSKLIGHDPCLFHKKALIKDSRSILLTFSREVLSGIGDVTKVLRNYSYVVSHKQSYLDEYDYAVTNLCTDLRDGVRLCRVMELMTGKRCLTCRCRVPAISRLQKVHNVSIALNALKETGYSITGGIEAKCIADGHREKSLSLLWQIIYKFQRPRFDKAASTLQRWWRSKKWLVRLKELLRRRRHGAATVIQRAWRCYAARRQLETLRQRRARQQRERTEAARAIQLRWRERRQAETQRRNYQLLRLSVIKIQIWWRRIHQTRPLVRELARQRCLIVQLQRRWRVRCSSRLLRTRFLELRRSAGRIQVWWRTQRRRRAAVKIQTCWRARRERRRFLALRRACIAIQSQRRALLLERHRRAEAALKIQTRWRARREQRRFLALRRACITIQSQRRALLLERHRRTEAALKIQTRWRARRERRRFLALRRACLAIQIRRQAQMDGRRERAQYERLKWAAGVIGSRWRASRLGLKIRLDYRRSRLAIISLQLRWRSLLERRRREVAALRIQACWRARRDRRRFLTLRHACIAIQTLRRAQLLQRQRREKAALRIQTWWRARAQRRRFLSLRHACLGLQSRRRFLLLRRAAIKIQAHWRMRHQQRSYRDLRVAAIVLQKHWRRVSASQRYRQLKLAVKLLERRREHVLTGRRTREQFLRLRAAIVGLQRRVRAKRQAERSEAALKIQCLWRALLQGRRCRSEYQMLRTAACVLQRRYRLRRQGRAVRIIEDWWISSSEQRRARQVERVRFRRVHEAAIKIQSVWRGYRVRQAASKKLAVLRSRAEQAAKDAVPTATLAFRLRDNIEKFKYASNIGQLSVSLASLDVLVRLLPNACIEVCQLNLVSKLYDILTQANRSLPWLDVCLKDISILLTLAKFKPTTEYVLKLEYVEVLARILTISSDKKEDLFLHTATLMWMLTENCEYAEAAKNCPRTRYLLQSLYTSINKKFVKPTSTIARCAEDALPSPNPDWGLRNKRPRTFSSVSQAVISLASRLHILNITQPDMQRSFNFSMSTSQLH